MEELVCEFGGLEGVFFLGEPDGDGGDDGDGSSYWVDDGGVDCVAADDVGESPDDGDGRGYDETNEDGLEGNAFVESGFDGCDEVFHEFNDLFVGILM